jgi:hypothetical protein
MSQPKLDALVASLKWLGARAHALLEPRPDWAAGIKRIAEVTMLADMLLSPAVRDLHPRFVGYADFWIDAAWRALRRGDFFIECVEQDPVWIGLAMTYVKFHKHGRRNPRFEDLLVRQANDATGDPFVKLAVACAYAHLGVASALDIDSLAAESWIARTEEYAVPLPRDTYHTTHVAIWLGELDRITGPLHQKFLDWTALWTAHYQRAENVDLVAELIMQSHYIRGPVREDAWPWMLARQEADGSFPGIDLPSVTIGRFHPTLVSAIALAQCLGGTHCRCI